MKRRTKEIRDCPWLTSRILSLIAVLMVMLFDDPDVLVEAEDGAGEEEGLGHVVEQAGGDVVDVDDLVGYERDAAHDEQHCADVLRDFKSCVFHSIRCFVFTLQSYEKILRYANVWGIVFTNKAAIFSILTTID